MNEKAEYSRARFLKAAVGLIFAGFVLPAWGSEQSWVIAQRSTPRAKRILRKFDKQVAAHSKLSPRILPGKISPQGSNPKAGGTSPATTSLTRDNSNTEWQKRFEQHIAWISAQDRQMKELVMSRRFKEGRFLALRILEQEPAEFEVRRRLGDIDIYMHRYQEAYEALLPAATPTQSKSILVPFSVACAHLGMVQPGQLEYVLSNMKSPWFGRGIEQEFREVLPAYPSAETIAAVSHLAMLPVEGAGSPYFHFHLEEALRLDPKNTLVRYAASTVYHEGPGAPNYDYAIAHVSRSSKMWQRLHGVHIHEETPKPLIAPTPQHA